MVKKIYLGIEILRMFLSFFIVIVHCYNKRFANSKLLYFPFYALCFYIPTFLVISFYFTNKIFISKNIEKIKERLFRILIPFFIWPIIFFLKFRFINYIKGIKNRHCFKILFYQFIIGDGFHGVFWFQFNLIIVTKLLTIIILIFDKKYLIIFKILTILLVIFIFSGYYNIFFDNFKHPVHHSIKPIASSLIYSLTGFFLGSINTLETLYKYRLNVIIICIPIIFCLRKKAILVETFGNYHIIIIELVIISLFIIFALLPFDKIKNNFIISLIKQITSYTGGVYYIHPEIRNLIVKYFKRQLKGCIINYLICYFICFFGYKIFKNLKLKYLFI